MGIFWNSKQSHATDTEWSGDVKTLQEQMKKEIRRRCHKFHQEQQRQFAAAEQIGEGVCLLCKQIFKMIKLAMQRDIFWNTWWIAQFPLNSQKELMKLGAWKQN